MNFKYKTQFSIANLSVSNIEESVSRASIENLKPFIPSEVNFNENIDLLGVAFNAAVVNLFNKNDDGIDTQTALKISKLFKHKPTNIEHKKEKVVGHILTVGYSKFGSSEILTPDELNVYTDPFNISLGAVVYKFVNKDFASALERSTNPTDDLYRKISTSWELGFNEYNIAVGSKNLKDAEIITNEKQILELKGKLKSYGGSGKLDDGTKIYRLVIGDVYPLGIGFTATPAADVSGVIVDNHDSEEYAEQPTAKVFYFKNHFFTKKNSHLEKSYVNPINQVNMNLETIMSEVKDALLEKKISQEAAANMTATFTEAIKKKDEEYRNDINAAKSQAEQAEKEKAELKASIEEVQKQLTDALAEISKVREEQKAAQALAAFNSRMEDIDNIFELDDEDRKVLAEEIKSLPQDEESFANFKSKLSVIWKNKNKEVKSEQEKEIQAKIEAEVEKRLASASKVRANTSSVEDILDKAKASNDALIPNNNYNSSKPAQSLIERFAEAFDRKNIIIS